MKTDDKMEVGGRWNFIDGRWREDPRGGHLFITGSSGDRICTTGYMIPCSEAEMLARAILKNT